MIENRLITSRSCDPANPNVYQERRAQDRSYMRSYM